MNHTSQHLFTALTEHPDITHRPTGQQGEYKAWCPWHDDRATGNPSLGINTAKNIVKCFSSRCGKGGAANLAKAWGIMTQNMKPPATANITATYDYYDDYGVLAYQVVRLHPKQFKQRKPSKTDPNGWDWSTKDLQPILYRLPHLNSTPRDEWVWIVEGEKDVDLLTTCGLVATTNPMGTGKWRQHYNSSFTDRHVAVIPDNDDPGITHAITVAWSLEPHAATVKLLRLPDLKPKEDIGDWLQKGNTVQDLLALKDATKPFESLWPPHTERSWETPAAPGVTMPARKPAPTIQAKPARLNQTDSGTQWGVSLPEDAKNAKPGTIVNVTDRRGKTWTAELVELISPSTNAWSVVNETREPTTTAPADKDRPPAKTPSRNTAQRTNANAQLTCPRCHHQFAVKAA